MKYDESVCKFNMDTGCVELRLRDGRKISIDCTGVEDALDITVFLTGDVQHLLFGVARSILMESLYFYNFLYDSFIYSMLIFMHTDR